MSKIHTRKLLKIPSASTAINEIIDTHTCIGNFTLMSYNVLSQTLIKRTIYPYAEKKTLKWKTRKTVLLNELLHYNPDVLFGQEVSVYDKFWKDELSNIGMESYYKINTSHGCCIAFNKKKFKYVEHVDIELGKLKDEFKDESFAKEFEAPNVGQIVVVELLDEKNDKVDDKKNCLIFANTHLYWNPKFNFVRLKQLEMIMDEITKLVNKYKVDNNVNVVFCGDLNSSPNDENYDYILNGERKVCAPRSEIYLSPKDLFEDDVSHLSKNHDQLSGKGTDVEKKEHPDLDYVDIFHSKDIEYQKDNHQLLEKDKIIKWNAFLYRNHTDIKLKEHQDRLKLVDEIWNKKRIIGKSVYSQYTQTLQASKDHNSQLYIPLFWSGEPIYTVYTNGWKGTVDYIIYYNLDAFDEKDSEKENIIIPVKLLELPTKEILEDNVALPNNKLGSDHVSIMCEFSIYKHN